MFKSISDSVKIIKVFHDFDYPHVFRHILSEVFNCFIFITINLLYHE